MFFILPNIVFLMICIRDSWQRILSSVSTLYQTGRGWVCLVTLYIGENRIAQRILAL